MFLPKVFFSLLLTIGLFGAASGQEAAVETKADLTSVNGIITNLYAVISGPAGQARDWDLFRSLFVSDAYLRAVQTPSGQAPRMIHMTPDEYIERVDKIFQEKGFFEEEINRQVDEFGYITQVFTTYQSRYEAGGPVVQRGINSVQLARYDGRYWIVSILWNSETEAHPIPDAYLGN